MSRLVTGCVGSVVLLAMHLPGGAGQAVTAEVPGGIGGPAAAMLAQRPEVLEAIKQFRTGNPEQAMAALKEAAKKYPDLPMPQIMLAQFYLAVNQPGIARSTVEQAVADAPNDPEPYAFLGQAAIQDHRVTEAGLLCTKALDLVSGKKDLTKREENARRQAWAGLAAVAEAREDWPAVQKNLEALLAEDPKNALALQQLGRALFQQKQYDEAMKRFQQAAQASDTMICAEANMARAYQEAGDAATASKYLLAAINANPTDFRTRMVAAQWSLEIGKQEQAEAQADAALKLNPQSIEAKFLRGRIALFGKNKNYEVAQKMFEQVHLQSPMNFAATNNLALALVEQGDEAKKRMALEYSQINVQIGPDQPDANGTLGWVLYRLGRLNEAENALRKAVSVGRPSPDTAYFAAQVFFERGRKEEAGLLVDMALKSQVPFAMRPEAEELAAKLKR